MKHVCKMTLDPDFAKHFRHGLEFLLLDRIVTCASVLFDGRRDDKRPLCVFFSDKVVESVDIACVRVDGISKIGEF